MNNFLAENQKLRCALLTKCEFNVAKADEAYKFIMGSEAATAEPQTETYPDGIYIVDGKGKAVLYTGPETKWDHCAGIGIKQGSKSLLVGLTDAADTANQNCELTTKQGGSRFFKSHTDAVADWDGAAGTEDLREILNPAIKLDEKQYIPSLGQMYFILCHLKAVNEALAAVGGQPIEVDAWYWASTSYSATYAWSLHLHGGYACAYTRATYQLRVRPVSAFF
jgi:hypothetical protein